MPLDTAKASDWSFGMAYHSSYMGGHKPHITSCMLQYFTMRNFGMGLSYSTVKLSLRPRSQYFTEKTFLDRFMQIDATPSLGTGHGPG
jgi:hypothetical protein